MARSLFDWLFRRVHRSDDPVAVCSIDAENSLIDFALRRLAFDSCVNLIANAIGNSEFQTLWQGEQRRGDEFYALNVEPNRNQNSSAFWHELIFKLYRQNEVLVISRSTPKGFEEMLIADSFESSNEWPVRENVYKNVTIGGHVFPKVWHEDEVMHITLNNENVVSVTEMIYASYIKLIRAAEAAYTWREGMHMKVHVDQMAAGGDGWIEKFQEIINKQVKPWIQNPSGVLPEFDGYKYDVLSGLPGTGSGPRDIRALYDDIFDFTARSFGIPPVLVKGDVADSKDAFIRWLTTGVDPLAAQLEEELNRKRYGIKRYRKGSMVHINTTTLIHFDMFSNADHIEKLVGSGVYSVNDILTAAGSARINEAWADKHYLTKNIAGMDEAAAKIDDSTGKEENEDA